MSPFPLLDDQIQFLKAENEILRSRIKGNRVILKPAERAKLLSIGEIFGHKVEIHFYHEVIEGHEDNAIFTSSSCSSRTSWWSSLCFSLRHLDYIIHAYTNFYNRQRPHQSRNNLTLPNAMTGLPPPTDKPQHIGKITCRRELGGLLKYYTRIAA